MLVDDVIWQWQQWPEMYGKCSESICLYLTSKGFVLKLKGNVYTMHQVWQCEEWLDIWQRDLANKCGTWKRDWSMLDEHDQVDVWFTLKERKKNAEMSSEPVSLVIKKGWLKWFGYVEQQWKWKEVNQGDISEDSGWMMSVRIWRDLVCSGRMHSLGENGEGKLRQHEANRGSPGRWMLSQKRYKTELCTYNGKLIVSCIMIYGAGSFSVLIDPQPGFHAYT